MSRITLNQLHRQNAGELNKLQEQHREKKNHLLSENQKQLRHIEKRHKEQTSNLKTTNQAAINHIRTQNKAQLNEVTQKGITDTRKTRSSYQQQREQIEQRELASTKNLEKRYTQRQQELKKHITKEELNSKNQEKLLTEKTHALHEQEILKRKEIQKNTSKEITNLQSRYQQNLHKINKDFQTESKEITQKQNEQLNKLRSNHNKKYSNAKKMSFEELNSLQNETTTKETQIKTTHQQKIEKEESKYKKYLREISEQNKLKTNNIKHQHKNELLKAEQSHQVQKDQLNLKHGDSIKELHKIGDQKIAAEKIHQDSRIHKIKEQHLNLSAKEKAQFALDRKLQEANYNTSLQRNSQMYKGNLKRQYEEFKKREEIHRNVSNSVFDNQTKLLNRELLKKQVQYVKELNQFNSVKNDPFYSIPHLNAELIENERNYVVQAQIPKHEQENIDIKIHKDKVVISGERDFAKKISNEENTQNLESHNYQTFRQEFKLDFPIYEKGFTKEYDGDLMVVTIPKLGSLRK